MAAYKSKLHNYALFCLFSGLALWQGHTNSSNLPFALLSFLRLQLVAVLYLIRTQPELKSKSFTKILSWMSAALPYAYTIKGDTFYDIKIDLSFLGVIGLILSTWGIVSLGKSFGISPAKRELITSGAYRWLKHPIYTGYFLLETSLTLSHLNFQNLLILPVSIFLYALRARLEEKILSTKT